MNAKRKIKLDTLFCYRNFDPTWVTFWGPIYDNILAALVSIDYAKLLDQECILLQLYLDKAYDSRSQRSDWTFLQLDCYQNL